MSDQSAKPGRTPSPADLHSRGLWRIVRRGLSREPEARWPDMDTLLEALSHAPRRRRRVIIAMVATAGLGLALGFLPIFDPCRVVEAELDGIWDTERRSQLRHHADGLGAGHVNESQQRIAAALDRWRDAWVDERVQVCRARPVLASTPAPLRLRDNCLTRQRQRVARLVELATQADAAELAGAVVAVAELPSPAACADDLSLLGVEPPPATIEAEVDALRDRLAEAHQLRLLGRVETALDATVAVHEAAALLGYGPLMAETLAERARAELEAGSRLRGVELMTSAIDLADIHRHDRLRAQLMSERSLLSLFELGQLEDGKRWLHQAENVHEREEIDDARAQARLIFAHARVHELEREPEAAGSKYQLAVTMLAGTEGTELPAYIDALAHVTEGPEALELRREALERAREVFGPRHPRTAKYLYNYGYEALQAGRDGEAELALAAEVWLEAHDRPHPDLGKAQLLLARAALLRGDLDLAEDYARALQETQEQTSITGAPERGDPERLLAKIEGIRSNPEAALVHARAAMAAFERSPKGQHDPRGLSMRQVAIDQLLGLGRLEEAEKELIVLLSLVSDVPKLALPARIGLTELAVHRGELDRADEQLRTIERLDLETLVHYELNYSLLAALVELRRGQLDNDRVQQLTKARARSPIVDAQLGDWLDQLEITVDERRALGL